MTEVHVLIPSFNCTRWIERCLRSVHSQDVQPAQVLVIDDASTDPAYAPLAEGLCDELGWGYHRNPKNRKCPYNLRFGIDLLSPGPEDVIFLLDGDDFLPQRALSRIIDVYTDPEVWLTYGNYQPHPRNTGQTLAYAYPSEVIRARSFRTASACFNHPLTFRKFLWDEITDEDLQTSDGRWFTGGYDMVIMSPMLEMSAPGHYRFLDETLYCYNAVNPLSDATINVRLVEESREMMRRPKKPRLVRHARR